MRACGIIAEFDPLHNGHKYLMEQARASGCTHIAVVMSGSAVQRGAPAFCGKFFRADAALDSGADLVLELPAPYSCSNAEVFAAAGVSALAALGEGVITRLVFGSETDDISLITDAAAAADELAGSPEVVGYTSQGMSYPAALAKACEDRFGSRVASVFGSPNSTLAAEYCRALKANAPFIDPFAVKRAGAGHGSGEISEGFASASLLREMIRRGDDVSGLMPVLPSDLCDASKLDSIFLYALKAADAESLLSLPDMTDAIANRLLKTAAGSFGSAGELLMACKNRSLTLARLRRMAMHLVLGVRKEDISPLPYVRVLALNGRGRELLAAGEHTLPVDTSLARLVKTSRRSERTALIERRASELRALGTPARVCPNEFTVKVKLK